MIRDQTLKRVLFWVPGVAKDTLTLLSSSSSSCPELQPLTAVLIVVVVVVLVVVVVAGVFVVPHDEFFCRWVREFLNEENRGLDVLVEYLSFAQYAVT